VSGAVTAADRRRDRLALAIFAGGAFLYLLAYLGMHSLAYSPVVSDLAHPALRRFTWLWILSLAGLTLAGAGGVAMLLSFWRWHRRPKDVI